MPLVPASKILINGLVQGVGFRPTVSVVAQSLGLCGWVKNTSYGVEIVLFMESLENSLPKLASLDSIKYEQIAIEEVTDFTIVASDSVDINRAIMSPDNYVCIDCLKDIFDKDSRFYLYPFTNCTNCGPRYTVIKDLPYDRKQTALAPFIMCKECQTDYNDLTNRRYHAQASSCPKCGPKLDAKFPEIVAAIKNGDIVAIKGVGGYVLLADAKNNDAIIKLRKRKHRKSKPFATMALNVNSIREYFASVSKHEEGLLESCAAPIVILNKKSTTLIADEVAPALSSIGVMLPSSPIFYILMYYLLDAPQGLDWLIQANDILLVATSANISGGTIISSLDNAVSQELQQIADYVVSYNRDITTKIDDSLILSLNEYDVLLRRARGFVPKPYYVSYEMPQVLGVGAELKGSLTFIRDNKAFVSQYLGDMSKISTIEYFHQIYNSYKNIYGFMPKLVVSDLHPDFYTTQFAASLEIKHIQVQHHIAHFASALGNFDSYNYQLDEKILGCILDGYGYGESGDALGGELLEFSNANFEFKTISQLLPITAPGGDNAEKEPWRIVVALCIENDLDIPNHLENMP